MHRILCISPRMFSLGGRSYRTEAGDKLALSAGEAEQLLSTYPKNFIRTSIDAEEETSVKGEGLPMTQEELLYDQKIIKPDTELSKPKLEENSSSETVVKEPEVVQETPKPTFKKKKQPEAGEILLTEPLKP